MAMMYTCMVFGLAEMASAMPVAGAGYGFARRALGPTGGFATGTAILIEYAIAPAAIAVFIGGYIEALGLFGLTSGWPVFLACYVIFIGIHLWGVGEALRVMFVITAIAVVALVVFVVGHGPASSTRDKLFDIPMTDAAGASTFLPFGVAGRAGRVRVRHLVLPRGRGRAAGRGGGAATRAGTCRAASSPRWRSLLVFAALMLLVAPGAAGSNTIAGSDNPLPEAIRAAYGGDNFLAQFVNYVGLAGLVASFFSIIYAYSRQLFALSRAGYLPRWMSKTGRRKTP